MSDLNGDNAIIRGAVIEMVQTVIEGVSVAWKVDVNNLCNGLTQMVMEQSTNPNVLRSENFSAMAAAIMEVLKVATLVVDQTKELLLPRDHNLL
jgi:hypothetical protein